jgi:hypothetical protein
LTSRRKGRPLHGLCPLHSQRRRLSTLVSAGVERITQRDFEIGTKRVIFT